MSFALRGGCHYIRLFYINNLQGLPLSTSIDPAIVVPHPIRVRRRGVSCPELVVEWRILLADYVLIREGLPRNRTQGVRWSVPLPGP